jgi:ribosomal-protein-alanine N-acetyltransferase
MTDERPAGLQVIETARLRLRNLRLDDAADQHAYARDPEVALPGMWDPIPTIEGNRLDLTETLARQVSGESMEWGIEHVADGRLIGRCGFARFRAAHMNGELGYALARPYWRHGYMNEAVTAVLAYGFERLGLHRIEAICVADNTASWRLLERTGFQLEGTARQGFLQDGFYKDLRRYALLKDEWLTS